MIDGTVWDVGDGVRAVCTFKDIDGALADPDEVRFKLKAPGADEVIYTYPTDDEIVRDSEGVYHVDIDLDAAGAHYFAFYGTGAARAAARGALTVDAGWY